MLIDWFTVAAQAVNFLLLVWLLKRFLYGPIVRAMRQREERIARDLDQAETARDRAKAEQEALAAERAGLEQEREAVLHEAREQARQWREQAMQRARDEVDAQRRAWRRSLHDEQKAFATALRARIALAVMQVSREALGDLADGSLEERLAARLLRELPQNGFAPPEQAVVRTGFPPGEELRERLRQGLRQHWEQLRSVEFEHAPELGFGLECVLGDHKIHWNIERYMAGLEERVLTSFARGEGRPEDTGEDGHGS